MPPYKTLEEKMKDCPCNGCVLVGNSDELECEKQCITYQYWNSMTVENEKGESYV